MVLDILGRELAVDDYVTFEGVVYVIVKFTPKMVSIKRVKSPSRIYGSTTKLRYAVELTLVPKDDVLLWILKQK